MTKDEIIEMAKQAWISDKEAELITEFDEAYLSCTYLTDLTAFAKLVAQHEREACANLCDDLDDDLPDGLAGWQYGETIRARGHLNDTSS